MSHFPTCFIMIVVSVGKPMLTTSEFIIPFLFIREPSIQRGKGRVRNLDDDIHTFPNTIHLSKPGSPSLAG